MANINDIVEEIVSRWEVDAIIEPMEIEKACLEIPKLHSRYLRMLSAWKTKKTMLTKKLHELKDIKSRYWTGKMDKDELQKYGWKQWQQIKPSKTEMDMMFAADPDVSNINVQLDGCETIIYVLESIMNQINARNFTISNYIKMKMFNRGDTM